jgi:hypothetical protein
MSKDTFALKVTCLIKRGGKGTVYSLQFVKTPIYMLARLNTTTYDSQNKRFKVQTLETRIKLKGEKGKKTLQTSCQCLLQQTNTNLHLNFHIMQPVNLNLQEIRAGCHMNMKSSTSTHIKPTHFFQFLFKRVNSTNNSVKYISLPMALPENTKSTEFSKWVNTSTLKSDGWDKEIYNS